jgi:hypothetical protein
MNPHDALVLAEQRRQELMRNTAESRRGPVRRLPRLRLSWSRTTLAAGGRGGSSVMIIISAYRSA